MNYTFNKKFILTLVLFVLFSLVILEIYLNYGVGWDFVAHYLSARALISSNFTNFVHSAVAKNQTSINFGIIETKKLYFETYRAPLSIVIMAIIELFLSKYIILLYLFLMVILLFIGSFYLSKSLNIEFILLSSLLLMPYLFIFPFIINSEEMLSLSLMLIALGFILKGKWQAGIFLGLASLSKYTSLIFLPLLLFSGSKKKIIYSYLAFGITTLPWFLFNYVFFGNPIYSYLSSIQVSLESSVPSTISIISLLILFANFIPAIFAIILFQYKKLIGNKIKKPINKIKKIYATDPKLFPITVFFILSIIEFIILGTHEDIFDQTRYAYFLYASIAIILSIYITKIRSFANEKDKYKTILYIIYIFSFVLMILSVLILYVNHGQILGINKMSILYQFRQSNITITSFNVGNCSVISNDWVYLRYYGISAFSPYSHTLNSSNYLKITFNNIGTSPNAIQTQNDKILYHNSNFTIFSNRSSNC